MFVVKLIVLLNHCLTITTNIIRIKLTMKTLKYFFILLIFVGLSASAQEQYNVTRVQGKVNFVKTGKAVIAGDILNSEDQLSFENIDSYVIAINQTMLRFQIKLTEPTAPESQQVFTARVGDVAVITKKRSLMAARFNPSENEIADLKNYFGNEKFSVIGDKVDITLNSQKYPLNDNKFIVFYYRVDNNPISKKIGYEQQTLKLDKSKILSTNAGAVSGNEIANLAVYNYEATTKTSEEITKFTLIFVDKEALKNEFNTILPILKRQKMNDEEIKKYLIEYYYDFYGATDSKTIDAFAAEVVKSAQ